MQNIKFGDIKYYTMLNLRDKINSRSFNGLDLVNLEKLKIELELKIKSIETEAIITKKS